MIRRVVNGWMDRQTWADEVGETLQNVYLWFLRPVPLLKDLLHGTWLGHALHPAITDVPVGAFTAALVLDIVGMNWLPELLPGAHWAALVGFVAMIGAAITGIADYTGTYGKDRRYGTIHSLVMFFSAAFYLFSVLVRFGLTPGTQDHAFITGLIGYVLLAFGAFIGGEIAFGTGYMVDRHAWESDERTWHALDRADFAEGQPTRAQAGPDPVLIVRQGGVLRAIHDTCSHAGCSLSEGKLVSDGSKIECGCHGSRFDLRSGKVARGPATYDQPRYEVRTEADRVEVRRMTNAQSQV